jgi:hypothetical protein
MEFVKMGGPSTYIRTHCFQWSVQVDTYVKDVGSGARG